MSAIDSPLVTWHRPSDSCTECKDSVDFLVVDEKIYEQTYKSLLNQNAILQKITETIKQNRQTASQQDIKHYDYLEYLNQSLLMCDIASLFILASSSLPALNGISSENASPSVLEVSNSLLSVAISLSRTFSVVSCSVPSTSIDKDISSASSPPITNGEAEPVLVLCRICEEYVPIELMEEHSKNCVIQYESEFTIITLDERIKKLQKAIRNTVLNVPWPGDEGPMARIVIPMLHVLMLLDYVIEVPPPPSATIALVADAISRIDITVESSMAFSLLTKAKELIEEKARAADQLKEATQAVNRTRAPGGGSKAAPLQTTIAEFTFLRQISSGAYAKVFLAKKTRTGDIYAVKVTPKKSLKQKNEVKRVLTEKDILLHNPNPFIVDFYYSIIGEHNLYLVMEYLPGGDLYSLLQKIGCLDENSARIYTAQIVKALEVLHAAGIIHRDIKPDNILVSAEGKLKLTDFGLSLYGAYGRSLSDTQNEVVGTPDYLAPEIILTRPHSFTADYWSLGAVVFEFLTGVPPFHRETEAATFSQILLGRADWEELDGLSPAAVDLIRRLLAVDPERRLGAGGIQEIKAHEWFAGIDWDCVDSLPPVFVPQLADKTSTEYFEQRYTFSEGDELEADILSDVAIARTATPHSVSMTDLSSRSSFAMGVADEEESSEEDGDMTLFPAVALKSLQNYNALAAKEVRHRRSNSDLIGLQKEVKGIALGASRSFMGPDAK